MGKSHRVSRLLEIVTLLQCEEGWTAGTLAERFGISRTRVFGDIRALRQAGVPVERSRSGYRIAASFFLPSVRLTPREVLALLFPVALFSSGEADRAVQRSARDKLLSCLPDPLREAAEGLLLRTSVVVPTASARGEEFETLRAAVAERRRVAFDYEGRSSQKHRVEVDAYGIAYRKHAWYIVGHSVTHGEVRKFRVSRISDVEPTCLHFAVPDDFSVEACFEGAWYVFGGRPCEVGLQFSRRVARFVRERPSHPGQQIQTRRDGSIFYKATVNNLDEMSWWLMQYGGEATVVYPQELADKVVALAEGILAAHARRAAMARAYRTPPDLAEGHVAEPPPA